MPRRAARPARRAARPLIFPANPPTRGYNANGPRRGHRSPKVKTYPNAQALLSAWSPAQPPRAKPKVPPFPSKALSSSATQRQSPSSCPQAKAEGSRSSPQNTPSPPASTAGWLGGFSQETISPFSTYHRRGLMNRLKPKSRPLKRPQGPSRAPKDQSNPQQQPAGWPPAKPADTGSRT